MENIFLFFYLSETSKTSEVAILQLVPLSVLLSLYTGWKHLAKHNLCIK